MRLCINATYRLDVVLILAILLSRQKLGCLTILEEVFSEQCTNLSQLYPIMKYTK